MMLFKRRTILGGALAMPLAGCVNTVAPAKFRSLKVATFNIWHDKGDWPTRLKLLTAALRESDSDIIALQEVLEDTAKALPNQAETLARELDGYSVHFTSFDPPGSDRRYGNAILSRLPVIAEDAKQLAPLSDYRTALRVRVKLGETLIDIVGTHLAWQPDAGAVRAEQVADLMAWLPDDGTPLIAMGDFNAPLEDPGLALLTSSRFQSALAPGSAATTLNPAMGHKNRMIDHIFAERRWFEILDGRIIGQLPVGDQYASDHFGVAAALRLR